MSEEISKLYGQRVRVRVCGMCWRNNSLLMVNHSSLRTGDFWAPPGGGIDVGQTAYDTLMREFAEETGVKVTPGLFRFACEFIQSPLHAIELFFDASYLSGEISVGTDPEMGNHKQIIREVKWMTFGEIKTMPSESLHGIFKQCNEPQDLMNLNGYWHI